MKTFINRIALFAAGAVVLGTMAYGQSPVLKAQIPFAFRTGSGTMAAGDYTVGRLNTRDGARIMTLRNVTSDKAVFVLGQPNEPATKGSPAMIFRCGDNGCTLSGIRTSEGTVAYGPSYKSSHAKEVAVVAVPLRVANGD